MSANFESSPKASFSLKYNDISTSDVVAAVSNNVGEINAQRTDATWYSVSFRDICGDMWNKYEVFNLRLNSMSYQQTAAFGVAEFDRLVYFAMSGPAWENNNYSISRKTNIASSIIGMTDLQENIATALIFDTTFITSFRKQDACNIRIQLLTLDGQPPTLNAATNFPRISWFFDITGAEFAK